MLAVKEVHTEIKDPIKAVLWWVTGQRALAAVARAADGRGPQTELVAAACRHCGVNNAEDLLGCVRHSSVCLQSQQCPHEHAAR